MAEAVTRGSLATMLDRLPHETENPAAIRVRIRITTSEGKTILAFARAGEGKLSFTGWEMRPGMTGEEDWEYFVLGAERIGDPLHVINQSGLLGVVTSAVVEDRGQQ